MDVGVDHGQLATPSDLLNSRREEKGRARKGTTGEKRFSCKAGVIVCDKMASCQNEVRIISRRPHLLSELGASA